MYAQHPIPLRITVITLAGLFFLLSAERPLFAADASTLSDQGFSGQTAVVGTPVKLAVSLQSAGVFGSSIDGAVINFSIRIANTWQAILEDGVTTTSLVTDDDGAAAVYYVPPESLPPGAYSIRAAFAGSGDFEASELLGTLTVAAPSTDPSQVLEHTLGVGVPVILVHGNGSDNSGLFYDPISQLYRWIDMRDYALDHPDDYADFDLYVWGHNTARPVGFNGTSGNAVELGDFILDLLADYPQGTRVLLVGHSRGGLVIRSMMNNPQYDPRVLGVLTLGTPHHGSPFAVPDWVAMMWDNNLGDNFVSLFAFDLLVGEGGRGFETERMGSLNLAWTNMDGAVWAGQERPFDASFSAGGFVHLTPKDMNVLAPFADLTTVFSDRYKTAYGTLAQLNAAQTAGGQLQRLVTFAMYDPDLSDNPGWGDVIELVINLIGSALSDHFALSAVTTILSTCHEGVSEGGSVYFANDGLVPIQSGLLLNVSGGQPFCAMDGNERVTLDTQAIEARRQVLRHHIFFGDHLDLLDTDDLVYWATVTEELRNFIRGTVTVAPQPGLPAITWTLRGPRNFLMAGAGARVLTRMDPGPYTLTWGDLPGRVTPTPNPMEKSLPVAGSIVFTGVYLPVPTGQVRGFIEPPQAATDGGRWRVDEGVWQLSGAAVGQLAVGEHVVDARPTPGWIEPPPATVSVEADAATDVTAVYLPDCNNNRRVDDEDIAGGFSADVNRNGTPDECEASVCDGCLGDLNRDARLNGGDIEAMIGCLVAGQAGEPPCGCADLDHNGELDLTDASLFIARLTGGVDCP